MVETDVVVLGSGAAGLAAGLTAAVGGAQVTILDAAPVFGGTSAISGGGMWLPGNTLDPDYTDSMAEAKRYLLRLTMGFVPESVIDRYLAECGAIPDFFAEHSPLEFVADIGRPDYFAPWEGSSLTSRTVFAKPYELPRLGEYAAKIREPPGGGIPPVLHAEEQEFGVRPDPKEADPHAKPEDLDGISKLIQERLDRGVVARGRALVGGLVEGCLDKGVVFVSDTRGRSLIVEDGRVVGLRAEQNGGEVDYRARRGVVLASGGFEWNRDLWDTFMAVPYDGPATPPWNRGDGLIMAAQVGAKLGNLDKATWIPRVYAGEEYDGHPAVPTGGGYGQRPGEILVNRKGRRFTSETLPYNDIGRVMMHFDPHIYEFDNHPCFMVGDRHALENIQSPPPIHHRNEKGAAAQVTGPEDGDGYFVADTLRELAGKAGIDPDGLEAQVSEFNEHAVDGVDPVFHRGEKPWEVHNLPGRKSIGPLLEGPYVARRVRASVFGTRGGPVINEEAQIVDYAGRPIPGLYGAGNVVAHPFAWVYPGGGGTLGPCMTFGHIAGKSVLRDSNGA
jgi:succinate dehydrogenase/fumarate reductase flavoprotein subunit